MPDVVGKSSDQISVDRRYGDRTTTERRAERRNRLIEAALEAFDDRGYANTSIEQLCAAARISTRNFYEEFGSKEELLYSVYDTVNRRALEATAEAVAVRPPDDIEGRAAAGMKAYLETMTADPRAARIAHIESVGISPQMEAHRRAALDSFARLIEEEADRYAEASGAPERDFSLTSLALVGAIKELATAAVRRNGSPALDDVAAEACQLILVALTRSSDT